MRKLFSQCFCGVGREQALSKYGHEYGWFWEESTHPLAHGYLARCRFVSPAAIAQHYGSVQNGPDGLRLVCTADQLAAVQQPHTALQLAEAFVCSWPAWCKERNSDCLCPEEWEQRIYGPVRIIGNEWGDRENHFYGFGFWQEAEGVCRLWSRIMYFPK